jgi:hypothetical protein
MIDFEEEASAIHALATLVGVLAASSDGETDRRNSPDHDRDQGPRRQHPTKRFDSRIKNDPPMRRFQ